MKICPRCNTQLDDSAKFCPRCGTVVKSDNTVNEEKAASTEAAVNNTVSQPQQPAQPMQSQPQSPQPQPQLQQQQPQTLQQYQQPVQPVQQQHRQQPVQPQYQPPKQQYQQMPQYNNTAAVRSAQTDAGSPSVLSTLKSVCSSPVILIALIASSLAIVLNIVQSFLGPSNIFTALYASMYNAMNQLGLGYAAADLMESMKDVMRMMNDTSVIQTVIGQIPTILIVLGSWLAYASAANKNGPMKTGGLTLVKVIVIISLVCMCIVLGIITIIGGILCIAASGQYEELAPVLIAVVIVLLLLFAFFIMYYVFMIKTVSAIKKTAQTGTPHYKVSVFIAVCLFIAGAYALTSVPEALVSGYIPLMVSGFAGLCSVVSSITYGIFIFMYRSRMKKLYDSTNRYTGTPGYYYQPQGGGQGYYQPPQMNGQGYYQPQQGNGQNNYQPPRQ